MQLQGTMLSPGRGWVGEEREAARLETLRGFGILDTAPEQVFDDLTELAGQLCGTPMALVSLVDDERQWFKSRVGIDVCETSRDESFCSHAIDAKDVFVVRDATADPRFADNPLVTGEPHVRFYAGAPLLTAAGHNLGTLCVLDTVPRDLTDVQLRQLHVLARQVVSQLELRRQTEALRSEVAARTQAQAMVVASERRFRALFEHSPVGIAECLMDGTIVRVNPHLTAMLGYADAEIIGKRTTDLLADEAEVGRHVHDLATLTEGTSAYFTSRVYRRKDGSRLPALIGVAVSRDEAGEPRGMLATLVDMTAQVTAEEALRAARDELAARQVFTEAVLDSIDTGIEACDAAGTINVVNRTIQGWAPGVTDADGGPSRPQLYDLTGVPLSGARSPLNRILAEGSIAGAEMLIAPVGQPAVYVVASGRRVTAADGRLLGAVVAMTDVTAARAQTRALQLSEASFRTTFEHAPSGLAVVSAAGPALQVNPALCRIVGRTADELLALPNLLALAAPDDQDDLAGLGRRALEEPGATIVSEQRLQRPDGVGIWTQLTLTLLGGEDQPRTLLLQLEDTTERRETADRLTHQALYDQLTDLPNRTLLFDRAGAALARLTRHPDGGLLALLFLDLNGFKEINDTYGHEAGDQVLAGVAARLSQVMRPTDTVARIGGDEFLVLCENVPDRERAELIAERLVDTVAVPIPWADEVLSVTASIGIAYGAPGMSTASLVRIADSAMYEAKRSR
ncbi:hypothetical protein acdb102_19270 [Acidothermaceae bacterium B102]|nr:hypothetical protein acdb102_19270 [Acidothermaceae bacterium B102]